MHNLNHCYLSFPEKLPSASFLQDTQFRMQALFQAETTFLLGHTCLSQQADSPACTPMHYTNTIKEKETVFPCLSQVQGNPWEHFLMSNHYCRKQKSRRDSGERVIRSPTEEYGISDLLSPWLLALISQARPTMLGIIQMATFTFPLPSNGLKACCVFSWTSSKLLILLTSETARSLLAVTLIK